MASARSRNVGIVALIVLFSGSLLMLAVVQSRRSITVAEEETAARRPDPIALLAADVAAVRDDVRALGDGSATQLQTLHDALEKAADERESKLVSEVAQVRREMSALQTRLDRNATELAQAETRVLQAISRLPQPLHDHATAVSEGAETTVASVPIEFPPAASPPAQTTSDMEAAVVPAVPMANTESAPKKAFLSFKLPSQGFAFDQRQRFAIVPSLSRVGFDAKSTMHDFSGVTTAIVGEITTNPARPGEGCGGAVSAQASTLDTGLDARDEAMREILEPTRFPEIRFDWSSFETTDVDAPAQRVAGVARGKLKIHGNAREIAMPVTVAVDASKRLTIDGQTTIKMSDFGVRPPSRLGLISVEDEATLWIALRARTLGAAPEENR